MLTPAQNERLVDLFERVIGLDLARRRAVIETECADDPEVRGELYSLLAFESAGLGSFLETPIVPAARGDDGGRAMDAPYDSDEFMTPRPSGTAGPESAMTGTAIERETRRRLTAEKRYRLDGEISRGGMGVILKGKDSEFDRPVAIKVMRREFLKSPYLVHRFVEEAQINGRLQHPGIVPVYDLGLRTDELPYFAMKLIEGRTLAEVLHEKPDPIDVLGIFEQVCQATAYAHSRGIVHRDLKPSNVMVGAFGEVHVLDWGMAKVLDRDASAAATASDEALPPEMASAYRDALQSRCGTIVGTLPYMPPEQARGELERMGPTADVFALGAMICQLLTGRPAYVGDAAEMYRQAIAGDLSSARGALAQSGADPELIALADECLEPDPAERPHDASAVAVRIREYLRSIEERRRQAEIEAAEARAVATQERRARRLTFALTSVVALVVLSAGLGITWWNGLVRERAALVAAEVDAELGDATRAFEERRFDEACWHVEGAKSLLGSDDATAGLRERAAVPLADVERRARLALDNNRRLAELESIRMPERRSPGAPDYRETDWRTVDAAYHALFLGAGMDPDAGTAAEAAARIAERQVVATWAPTLDEWSFVRARAGRDEGAGRLSQLADLVDPDPRRTELRHAMRTGDGATLVRHAEPANLATMSASTLNLLGNALQRVAMRPLAIEVLRAGCQRNGTDFSLHMNLARTLMVHDEKANAAEASRHYLAASVLRPGNVEARHELARTLHMFLGQHERAAAILRDMLQADPDDAHIVYHLGYVLIDLERPEEAITTLQRALTMNPRDTGSLNSLGSIYLRQQKRKQAIEAYRKATEIDPEYAIPFNNLGIALQRSGMLDEARTALERAIELDPSNADTYSTLGIVAVMQQRHAEAVSHFEKAIAIDDTVPDYWTNLGHALGWVNKVEAAFAAYTRALKLDPDFTKAHYNVGTLNLTLGRIDDAEKALWECIRSDPRYLDAYNALGGTYWAKDWNKVANAYERGVAENPRQIDFYEYLGEARKHLGQHELAIAAYQKLIELDGRYKGAHENLGKELMMVVRFREALEAFERAREIVEGDKTAALDRLIEGARREIARVEPLERILAGEADSDDRAELLAAAALAFARSSYAVCARLHARALSSSGEPIDPRGAECTMAFRAAALAVGSEGVEASGDGGDEVVELRRLARAWLGDLVEAWVIAAPADAATRRRVAATFTELEQADELRAIRDPDVLTALPEGEREAFEALWRRIAGFRAKLE